MRDVYISTFADIARDYHVHIAAGTTLLPRGDQDATAVYNRFFLFGPDGSVLDTADKVNLIDLEAEGGIDLSAGRREDLTVWHTEIGSFAPVICYDAWDAPLVEKLVAEGAQMLLVPSANPEPWHGHVAAERREGMYARVSELQVPGVEVFAVGDLAGLKFEGRSWILEPDATGSDGVCIRAQARTATESEIISATVRLPAARRRGNA
jgi:predicted amidohydrolase